MAGNKKPTKEDLSRGGYNPVPVNPVERKEQFGPLPSDDPKGDKYGKDQKRRGRGSGKR